MPSGSLLELIMELAISPGAYILERRETKKWIAAILKKDENSRVDLCLILVHYLHHITLEN